MKASAKIGSETVEMSATEGALELWSSIVVALRQAGYAAAGPEYLRLSRVLTQQYSAHLLAGGASAARWGEIRRVGAEAVELLGPVVEAASLLARLPTEVSLAPEAKPVKATKARFKKDNLKKDNLKKDTFKKDTSKKRPRKARKSAKAGAKKKGAHRSAKRKRTAKK